MRYELDERVRRGGYAMTAADEHECFYRGCKEIVAGRYHCDRHEEILQRRRDAQARRNSDNAAAKRAHRQGSRSAGSETFVPRLFPDSASNGYADERT